LCQVREKFCKPIVVSIFYRQAESVAFRRKTK
jgi:hypothetical protein